MGEPAAGEPDEPPSPPAELGEVWPDGLGDLLAGAGRCGCRRRRAWASRVRASLRRWTAAGRPARRSSRPTPSSGGRISFSGRRADAASVLSTRGLAAFPTSTPKPRNTSTSSADTRGEGSVRPGRPAHRAGAPAADRGAAGAAVSAALAERSRCRSRSSSGLRVCDPRATVHAIALVAVQRGAALRACPVESERSPRGPPTPPRRGRPRGPERPSVRAGRP